MIVLLIALGLVCVACATIISWKYISEKTLHASLYALVLSYPFERIPSVDVGGANLKIGQIVVLFSWYIVCILIAKGKLLQTRISPYIILVVLFFATSLFSLSYVIAITRYATTELGAVLVMSALVLIGTFAPQPEKTIRHLVYVMIGVSVFALYQLVGDFVGIPYTLTGLREDYTKIVFGIARVHGTAIEPQYFAHMLALPFFYTLFSISHSYQWVTHHVRNVVFQYLSCVLFASVLLLTISKGAIAIMVCMVVIIALSNSTVQKQLFNISRVLITKYASVLLAGVGVASMGVFLWWQKILPILINIYENILATIEGTAPSLAERSLYVTMALSLLPQYVITGIGSGQYGAYVQKYFNRATEDGGYLIVNNVYIEVLLERGVLALVCFIGIIVYPLWKNIRILRDNKIPVWMRVTVSALVSAGLVSVIQWTLFSPLYIMPIFIIFGLMVRIMALYKGSYSYDAK